MLLSILLCFFKLVKYWPEKGQSGFLVWRYLYKRDDPSPAPWTKAGKKRSRELGLVMQYPEGYEEKKKEEEENGKNGKRKSSAKGIPCFIHFSWLLNCVVEAEVSFRLYYM